jgi:ankyrin repeat protein
LLVENKANVDAECDVGFTPLHSMIRGAIVRLERQEDPQVSIDIARLLCLSGADVNKRLSNGKTLLQMTADAARQMTGRTAKQKLKELFTVLQTTKPVQKNMENGKSPMETKTISSGWDWMNLLNWLSGTKTQKLEEKVSRSEEKNPQNMDNSFFGSGI